MGLYPKQNRILPIPDTSSRYFFWELDTLEPSFINHIYELYRELHLPVFIHNSARGLHFICLVELPPVTWSKLVAKARSTNKRFPPTTLRVKANKYVDEIEYYKHGHIEYNQCEDPEECFKIREFQFMLTNQQLGLMAQRYFIVRYRIDKPHDL